jgi:hypothetical protein
MILAPEAASTISECAVIWRYSARGIRGRVMGNGKIRAPALLLGAALRRTLERGGWLTSLISSPLVPSNRPVFIGDSANVDCRDVTPPLADAQIL